MKEGTTLSILIALILTLGVFLIIQKTLLTTPRKSHVCNLAKKVAKTEPPLIELLEKYRVKNPKVVLAQAQLETGNFTAPIYTVNKNLFSMRLPKSRPTSAIGEKNGYAVFASPEHSVIDYAIYQARIRRRAMTDEEYIQLLIDSCYASDERYKEKLKQLITKNPKTNESEQIQDNGGESRQD